MDQATNAENAKADYWKQMQQLLEAWKKTQPQPDVLPHIPPTVACPRCGYCPHCGRGNYQAVPFKVTF